MASQLRRVETVAMLWGLRACGARCVGWGLCFVVYARLGITRWWWFGGSSHVAGDAWVFVWWWWWCWPRARARGRKNDVGVWCRAILASQCHHGRPQASFKGRPSAWLGALADPKGFGGGTKNLCTWFRGGAGGFYFVNVFRFNGYLCRIDDPELMFWGGVLSMSW